LALAACGEDSAMKTAFERSEKGVEAVSSAESVECATDRRILTVAVETYVTIVGQLPANEDALVNEQILRKASEAYDLADDGSVIAAPNGPCAV
jgi:hypothetical protein